MADHYIGINRGQQGSKDSDFTRGTASGATDLELRIADAAGLTRNEIIDYLSRFAEFLVQPSNLADTKFPIK